MPVCVSSSAPSKVLDPEVAVNKEEYQVFEELGRGRFGTVFHCFQHRGLRLHQNGGLGGWWRGGGGCRQRGDGKEVAPGEIAKLFPNLFGQPSAALVLSDSHAPPVNQKLKIGVVLSGGQAPGGHNVISGIFDLAEGSTLYGFRGGPAGIMKCKYVELTSDYIYPYRNQGGFDMIRSGRDKIETPEQFKQAEETVQKLDLEGLVVIGGDDSNTNACLLAEHFRFL
ncbi:Pyrophosphate--fructose 6-phosphate 1-phosphotransferase subunit beta [Glycine soja]|uniref:Pyrophosphate--fructose 6-phosphate 1-phosphotransferase subunit beta n=1 Tax=Glycine soja TaxID=3848 RepID=A0A0B2R6L6_GLYSO|nr:Pyrophosphate--fructose 6-phosphate 1-phosphotransferase subunit beta [Glycine soja]